MDDHRHDHDHEGNHLSPIELRVRALESLLIEKGYVEEAALDELVQTYEKRIGPRNGAMVVARCWTDPAFSEWLLRDASAAIHSMGFTGRQGEHIVAVENTPEEHNMVVCTLCSCYPWPVLGLPPDLVQVPALSLASGHRPARRARGLRGGASARYAYPGLGLDRRSPLPGDPDAAGRHRWLGRGRARSARVARLDDRVTAARRERLPGRGGGIMNGGQDLGGMMGFGPVRPEPEPKDGGQLFHEPWEQSAFAVTLAVGGLGLWNIDQSRQMRESLHPAEYLRSSYYEIWIKGLERLLLERGLVSAGELASGRARAAPVAVKPLPRRRRSGRR